MKSVFVHLLFIFGFVISSFSFLSIIHSTNVYACSCIFRENLSEFEVDADAIFRGKAVNSTFEEVQSDFETTLDPYTVEFQVFEYWKGTIEAQTFVKTALDSASCGFNFEVGEEYLVFAYEEDGELHTNLCSGTTLVSDDEASSNFVGELGKGEVYNYTLDDEVDEQPHLISDTNDDLTDTAEDEDSDNLLLALVSVNTGVSILILLLIIWRSLFPDKRKDMEVK